MNKQQIRAGAILSYFSIALNILAALIYTPWMIRQIGESQYGIYTLANSLITLFLVDFGLGTAVARYLSKYRVENKEEKICNFLGAIYRMFLIIDVVIVIAFVVIYFLIPSIYVKLTYDELEQFRNVYIIVALFSVLNFPFSTLNGILTAYEQFIYLKWSEVLQRLLTILFTVIFLLLGYELYALVIVNVIVGTTITIYKLRVVKRRTPVNVNIKYVDKRMYKDILSFSVWVTIASLGHRLVFTITPSILGVMANSTAIAVFGVITALEGNVYLITSAINGMFMPTVARIYTEEYPEKKIEPIMTRVGRFQYALNALIIVGFALLGKDFIVLWMGETYIEAYYGTLLVIIPGLFYNSLQIANTAITVTNRVNIQAYITVLIGIINAVCSCFLSKQIGLIGACVSICISYTIKTILYNIVFYKVMKINILLFAKNCYIKMSIPMILTGLIGGGVNIYFQECTWINIIIRGIFICAFFLGAVMIFGVNREERARLLFYIKGKKER